MPEVTGLGRAPRVREMTADDLEAVARLEGELFGAEAWSRDLLAAELKASHGPRGYAGLYHAGGLSGADLLIIATIPSARGRGIASLMLIELVSTAREVGCPDVLLEVRQSNEAAQRLYARHGFVTIGRRRRYYQAPPEDAVVMRLTLRPRPGPVGAEAGESNPI